jgi:hypothetical protein
MYFLKAFRVGSGSATIGFGYSHGPHDVSKD